MKGIYKDNKDKFFSVVADEVAVAKSQKLLFWRLRLNIRKKLFTWQKVHHCKRLFRGAAAKTCLYSFSCFR